MAVETTNGFIRCGHCKNAHATVARVRLCAQQHGVAAEPAPAERPWQPKHQSIFDVNGVNPNGTPRTPRTQKSITEQLYPAAAPAVSAVGAQAQLDAAEDKVPAGRYAIVTDGVTKFYVVDKPTEGKWSGYTFVSAQASDDLWRVKRPDHRLLVLTAIAEDVRGALVRYGMEIGKCGVCNRTLTDPESRAYGIGPVCRGKLEGMGF